MLVRLTSSTSGKMIMFAEHAHLLFGWIGKECAARGVFTREQLPEAIAGLYRGVEEEKRAIDPQAREKQKGEEEPDEDRESPPPEPTTLRQRAQPLIQLMERTLKEDGFVLWEAPGNF
ncbi:MAG: DUF1840 domain-containing protein [Azoarcus sp.]|jgi:Sec-independent protein translocase protein TatA|nr:DUF1840 domain-containing protein [Azoarcus sp.]